MAIRRPLRGVPTAVLTAWLIAVPALAQQPPGTASEYVPVPEGSIQTEQLPAAPLLIAAYAFFIAVVVLYVWTLGRRLTKVETEMRALEQKAQTGRR